METLAFLHAYVVYENPSPVLSLRRLKGLLKFRVLSAGWIRLALLVISLLLLVFVTSALAALRCGDVGEPVVEVQQALFQVGHDPGPIDGIFGEGTKHAVLRFQERQGLVMDGVVGPATAAALGMGGPEDGVGNSDAGADVYLGDRDGGNLIYVATNGCPLNVRSGPGLGYSVIYTVENGSALPTTGRVATTWIELADGGWVSSQWVY